MLHGHPVLPEGLRAQPQTVPDPGLQAAAAGRDGDFGRPVEDVNGFLVFRPPVECESEERHRLPLALPVTQGAGEPQGFPQQTICLFGV